MLNVIIIRSFFVLFLNCLLILFFCLGIWLEFFLVFNFIVFVHSYFNLYFPRFCFYWCFVYVFFYFLEFGRFAGTCTPAFSPVCGSLGESVGSRFYKSWRRSASSSLCTEHVPMPVYRRAFKMQTTRQVQSFTSQLLVFCFRVL